MGRACNYLARARSSRTAIIGCWQTRAVQRSAVLCFLSNNSSLKRRSSMKRVSLLLAAGIVLCLLVATSASAQVARVFLAGTGNDAGDCTNQATPCRSLQGAVTACPVNGEITILAHGGS